MNELVKEKYKKKLLEISEKFDTEQSHKEADNLLCDLLEELGFNVLVTIYKNMDKWYA